MSLAKADKVHLDEYGSIRKSGDLYSIYDSLKAVLGKKNPHQAWSDLSKTYPEVLSRTETFKFSGQGQQTTLVATEDNLIYILSLLPGKFGRTIREEAIRLFIMKVKNPSALASELVTTAKTVEQADEIFQATLEARQRYAVSYHPFKEAAVEAGGKDVIIALNYHNTKAIRGKTPSEIRATTGAKTGRENMTYEELVKLACVQVFQANKLKRTQSKSSKAIEECREILDKFLELDVA